MIPLFHVDWLPSLWTVLLLAAALCVVLAVLAECWASRRDVDGRDGDD